MIGLKGVLLTLLAHGEYGFTHGQFSGATIRDRPTGGEVTNLLFKFFEGSNEEIMGRGQKKEILW